MIEIFKPKKDYEGLYEVSNLGRVKSLGNGNSNNSKPKLLKLNKTKKGYLRVQLCKDGKGKKFLVHRLVAETFLPNPNNLPQVNHIDENKENNFAGTPENDYKDGNLEWCSNEYNHNYGKRNENAANANTNGKCSKKVLQFTLDGIFIREWPSTQECGRNGFNQGHVWACCNGERKSHKGFKWMYADDYKESQLK